MRIAIYGAGSMGTVLGAYLTRAGIPVTLVNRNKAHIAALRENGAHITGTVDFTALVEANFPQELEGTFDLIILLTKQLKNVETAAFLKPFLGENGVLLTMQNGLPEPELAEILGERRIIGCTVAWGAAMVSPGVCELTSAPSDLSFELGRMNGAVDEPLKAAQQVLSQMCPAQITENLMGVRWSKLLTNAAFSGMSTVLGCNFGAVADDKTACRCAQRIIKECIDVCAASGIKIEPIQGKNIVRLFDYHNAAKQWISAKLIPVAIRPHRLIRASMLQDIEHGKPCEIDAINGAVCRAGERAGVKTPFNDAVVALVREIEAGRRKPCFANLADMPPLR